MWCAFVRKRYDCKRGLLPPTVQNLLEWSHSFRCVGTFSNYVGYLRTICLARDFEMPPAGHPALHRAKASILKRMLFVERRAAMVGHDSFLLGCCALWPGRGCFYRRALFETS